MTSSLRVDSTVVARLAAIGMLGLAVHRSPVTAVLSAVLGLGLLAMSRRDLPAIDERMARICLAGLAMLSMLTGTVSGVVGFPQPSQGYPIVFVGVVSIMLVLFAVGRADRVVVVLGVLFLIGSAVQVVATYPGVRVGFDAYRSHEFAADAIEDGLNPYTDAVMFEDGAPTAEPGALIEGYAYPPATLLSYAGSSLLFGDSRWASVAAIALVLYLGFRSRRASGFLGAGLILMLASMPFHRAIIWSGWTEPVALVLLVAGARTWRKPLISGVLLGVGIAAKQYLVILLPVLFLFETGKRVRTGLAVLTGLVTVLPVMLLDFDAFWYTLIQRPLEVGSRFRPDSQSLSGAVAQLGGQLTIPSIVVVLISVAVTFWVVRTLGASDRLLEAMAAVLAVLFLAGLAFPNYWWLVSWLVASGVLADARTRGISAGNGASSSA